MFNVGTVTANEHHSSASLFENFEGDGLVALVTSVREKYGACVPNGNIVDAVKTMT